MDDEDEILQVVKEAQRFVPWRSVGAPSIGLVNSCHILSRCVMSEFAGWKVVPTRATPSGYVINKSAGLPELIQRYAGDVAASGLTPADIQIWDERKLDPNATLAGCAAEDAAECFFWGSGTVRPNRAVDDKCAQLGNGAVATAALDGFEQLVHYHVSTKSELLPLAALTPANILRILRDESGAEEVALAFEPGQKLHDHVMSEIEAQEIICERTWGVIKALVDEVIGEAIRVIIDNCLAGGLTLEQIQIPGYELSAMHSAA